MADGKAAQACLSCRQKKRKCDKSLPSCSLCEKLGRGKSCDYSSFTASGAAPGDLLGLQKRWQALDYASQTAPSETWAYPESWIRSQNVPFPSLFFLDTPAYGWQHREYIKPRVPIPQDVRNILGGPPDVEILLEHYFTTSAHSWLPIVSKVRLYRVVKSCFEGGNLELEPDTALLFLCMKLVTGTRAMPGEGLYQKIKSFFTWVESQGVLSVHMIQAAVLISVYEIGHAIYPAAYLSVSHCVSLGNATGIQDRRNAPQLLPNETRWTEQEERRRVWWAILLLERYINIPNRHRPLLSAEPPEDDPLPTTDISWDNGVPTPNDALALTSSTDIPASAFARTCQVAYLIGKYHRHVNDRNIDLDVRFSDAVQLHRTITALKTLLVSSSSPEGLWTSIALCYSTLIALYDAYCCTDGAHLNFVQGRSEMQRIAVDGLRNTSVETAQFAKALRFHLEASELEAISPLVTDCLYASAASFVYYIRESEGDLEAVMHLDEIRKTLAVLQPRWDVASVYLRELELQECH